MIAVIFEVELKDAEGMARYLDIAASLRQELPSIDGFISVERFQSLTEPNRLLSLSYWRDEDAIRAWRQHPDHAAAQVIGKADLFRNWHIRIAPISRSRSPDAPATSSSPEQAAFAR